MACTTYEADGWGVGEVWLDGARLVWHELPRLSLPGTRARARVTPTRQGGADRPPPSRSTLPAKRARMRNRSAPKTDKLIQRFRAYFAGQQISFGDVQLELDDWTPFQLDIVRTLRRVPYGEEIGRAHV